jgi:tetratricopeptide (TPR) repeat protein
VVSQNLLDARLSLAEALRVSGRLQEALPHYEQVVKSDPRIAPAWIGGAATLIGLARHQQAREWLTEARYVHPDQPELEELWARLPADTNRSPADNSR